MNICKNIIYTALAILCLAACSDNESVQTADGEMPMSFIAIYPGTTRATETDFEQGDRIGLFVTNDSMPLQTSGNVVNNEPLTLNGTAWTTPHSLYWSNGKYNTYAYYPYTASVTSTEAMPFNVATDQDTAKMADNPSGYEASDLLYASNIGIEASPSPVPLQFRHVMSRLKIRLVKGEDYEGDMPTTAEVYVHNTVTSTTVDLRSGTVTSIENGKRQTITAHKDGDYSYSAIIVPQTLRSRIPLVEVVMNGVSYIFESEFTFKPGMQHTITLILSGNPDQMKIDIGGETVDWK